MTSQPDKSLLWCARPETEAHWQSGDHPTVTMHRNYLAARWPGPAAVFVRGALVAAVGAALALLALAA